MDYSINLAEPYIGKRIIVSLRNISSDGSVTYSGLWGVVESVYEDGILLRVEGGTSDEFWMMPPDIDAIKPAQHTFYQLDENDEVVSNVDYEAYWAIAENLDDF